MPPHSQPPSDPALASLSGSGYVEVKSIEVKIGDEFWCPHTKRWLLVEVRNQQIGVCIGDYLVRRKIQKASSLNGRDQKPVLDACCGSRMFWFDRTDARAVFVDKRRETHTLPDKSSAGGSRELIVNPDLVADFTALPFEDGRFALVVFDPPHLVRAGKKSWLAKKYGKLEGDWSEDLRRGFVECFRVLRPLGTLVFKWNEHEVPVSAVLALTPEKPLFGNRCGKTAKSHWLVFVKPEREALRRKPETK